MATQEEIEQLKRDWMQDPIWDIEETQGFEEHREELLLFRMKKEEEWEKQHEEKEKQRRSRQGLWNAAFSYIDLADQAIMGWGTQEAQTYALLAVAHAVLWQGTLPHGGE